MRFIHHHGLGYNNTSHEHPRTANLTDGKALNKASRHIVIRCAEFENPLTLQDARNKLLSFMNAVDNGWSLGILLERLPDLKATIEFAFSEFHLDVPRKDIDVSTLVLPTNIFDSRTSSCKSQPFSGFNTSDFNSSVTELLVITDKNDFESKYKELNFSKFVDDMIKHEDKFTTCMSYFKNYLNNYREFSKTLNAFSSANVETGSGFIYESEVKVGKTDYITIRSGKRLNIKTPSYQYRNYHYKDKTFSRSSYL